jgi:hypothetical protein
MGEFGAVYVVSGHITGQTDTIPLRVEKLFQEYNTPAHSPSPSCSRSLLGDAHHQGLPGREKRRELAEAARLEIPGGGS